MSRFNVTVGSEGAAIGLLADQLDLITSRVYKAVTTGSSATAAAADFLGGVYHFSGGSTYTLTTPTAAQLVAAFPNVEVGCAMPFRIYNANSGTTTVTAGSGVTIVGPSTVATAKCQGWDVIITNATAGSEAVVMVAHSYANS